MKKIKLAVTVNKSTYGYLQPEIAIVSGLAGKHWRYVHATVYRLAAAVEMATSATPEAWCIIPDKDGACVHLELADATDSEAKRGVALLETVAKTIKL